VLAVIAVSAVYGIFVGATPGLTATMAVALLVPITMFLDATSAIAAIVTTVTCSVFAGGIPGALVRIPGRPASAAYTLDAYALMRAGRQEECLGVCLIFSVVSGMLGVVALVVLAPNLAQLSFTRYEYFWLCVLGLSCAAIVSRDSRLKGLFGLSLGLLISTVGVSPDHAVARFAFHPGLIQGVSFLPAMIGLFGVSEILRNSLYLRSDNASTPAASSRGADHAAARASFFRRHVWDPLKVVVGYVVPLLWIRRVGLLVSSVIGMIVGILPGAGAELAARVAYGVSKRCSRRPEEYGRGSMEGVADATAASNASLALEWVPALVFGIPGDSVTAIALGVLLMKNIQPGPEIFVKQPALVTSIFVVFTLANLLLLPVGWAAIRCGTLLVRLPRRVLMPVILVFCIVGAYSVSGALFDVWIMLAMGVLGFILEGWGIPLGPVVLGMVLGEELEHRFIQCLTDSDGRWWQFFAQPISALLAAACVALWFGPMIVGLARRMVTRHAITPRRVRSADQSAVGTAERT
jgi:putative tricarboxylic transport membrane protein